LPVDSVKLFLSSKSTTCTKEQVLRCTSSSSLMAHQLLFKITIPFQSLDYTNM